ncbi:MAG TPA: hypothetical protein VF610_03215 [Segetibacter sp.]|jgi:hypothetical protein
MKFFVAIILTALLSFAGALFFPWWIIAVAAFIVAVAIPQRPVVSFFAGFLALFLLWSIHSGIIDAKNNHILATKIAGILPLGNSYLLVILVTALVGSIVGGLAALTGSLLWPASATRKQRNKAAERKTTIKG